MLDLKSDKVLACRIPLRMNLNPFAPPPPSDAWLEPPDGPLFWLKGRCTIGREADNDLVLATPAVSRHHALLATHPSGYTVTDLQSSNGSFVNGELVRRPRLLRDGDEIKIGDCLLRYRCKRRKESAPDPDAGATTRVLDAVRTRQCWLLVVDIEGYTALDAQAGGEAALRRLQTWVAGARPLIERNGGRINSYIGDAVFAYWPCDSTKPAQVLGALAALETWRPVSPLPFRVVVHQGAALITTSSQGEELRGRDVTFVFRTEKIARAFGAHAMLSSDAMLTLGLEGRCESFGRSAVMPR